MKQTQLDRDLRWKDREDDRIQKMRNKEDRIRKLMAAAKEVDFFEDLSEEDKKKADEEAEEVLKIFEAYVKENGVTVKDSRFKFSKNGKEIILADEFEEALKREKEVRND